MLRKLKNFLKTHKNNFFVKIIFKIKCIFDSFGDKKAVKRLKKLNKIVVNEKRKTRIVFIIADSNTWNKLKPLYEEMKNRSNEIEVKIVCCPEPYKEDSAKTYNYFADMGYDCIDARIGNGPWVPIKGKGKYFDIKTLKPDYIFYSEPYNHYLPKNYRSNQTSKYAKLCSVAYGMTTIKEFLKIRPNKFYRDVYLCYSNNIDEMNYNISQFPKQHEKGIQKTKYLGFVAFSDIVKLKNKESKSWGFSQNSVRAIWTPRWTTDEKLGGSNFFRYKDFLFQYAKENSDIDILFRPHPMALDNFLRTGKMTVEEVDEFKNKCETEKNVSLDKCYEYITTFWNSSFLVTDISSIIVEYFITGKPIIFCKTENQNQKNLPYFAQILDSCYVVNDEKELKEAMDKLRFGQDDMKDLREKLIKELFGEDISSAPQKIVEDVLADFYNKK